MYDEFTKPGIISADDLHDLLNSPDAQNVKLLDATYVLPNSPDNPRMSFQKQRIGNAQYFDIDDIADHSSQFSHMLPSPDVFEKKVDALGVSSSDLVVVYGQSGMVMGPARAWWMFRAMGHDNVCVLDGGLLSWLREGFALNTAPPQVPDVRSFNARFRPELVLDMAQMASAAEDEKSVIVDARPEARFAGSAPEPRANLRSGHIPGSMNVPATSLINPETGGLKTRSELADIFSSLPTPIQKASDYKYITTCGSGVTACVVALAMHNLGILNIPVYDASWSEWGLSDSGQPTEKSS
jgi:thiosulfate/3-mercaptopyruvate sulfurtransferase